MAPLGRLSVHPPGVHSERLRLLAGIVAFRTPVRLFPRVNPFVPLERRRLGAGVIAKLTPVGLLSGVQALVLLHASLSRAGETAQVALERPFSRMRSHVFLELVWLPTRVRALRTANWFFLFRTGVRPSVPLKYLRVGTFETAHLTAERLLSAVSPQMRLKIDPPVAAVTARRAVERIDSRVLPHMNCKGGGSRAFVVAQGTMERLLSRVQPDVRLEAVGQPSGVSAFSAAELTPPIAVLTWNHWAHEC